MKITERLRCREHSEQEAAKYVERLQTVLEEYKVLDFLGYWMYDLNL